MFPDFLYFFVISSFETKTNITVLMYLYLCGVNDNRDIEKGYFNLRNLQKSLQSLRVKQVGKLLKQYFLF